MRRAVRTTSWTLLFLAGCLDGRGTIVVDGAGGTSPQPDDDGPGPGLDIGGDGDADGDPDGFGDGDADADVDADTDADADGDVDGDVDADADGDIVDPGGCVEPQGPFGTRQGDVLADFVRPLPECGTGDIKTLFSYCDSGAIVLHFNGPG
jgi:hypothetical protein